MQNSVDKNRTFLALDVETANEQYASICQIGIVFVEDGVITNTWETYVDPDTYFTNDWIHGIDENTVKGAPLFPEAYGKMIEILGDSPVVTHTTFDITAINQSLERYSLPPHNIRFIDSAKMARRADHRFLYSGYNIKNLCENYQIPYVNAHNAVGDATMAAKVVLYLLDKYEPTLEEWEISLKKKLRKKNASKIRLDGVEGGPLSGLSFVFTGALARPRKEIAELTASLGGNVRSTVNKDIDYLVIGRPSVYQTKYKKPSIKEQAARDLVAAGDDIQIIDEQEFNSIIEDVETDETN